MLLTILGAAAGGGLPQWNCGCAGCQAVRAGQVQSLTQSSIAIRSEQGAWFLVNASPDVRQQLERLRTLTIDAATPPVARSSPVAGILLTDAEIDHTTGLILLRESAQPLPVYSSASVKRALTTGYPLLTTLQNYCGVEWSPLEPGATIVLSAAPELEIEVFPLSTKPPRYMQAASPNEIWGIGLTVRDRSTGGVFTYAPGVAELDAALKARFEASNCILVDGTFWQNEELRALGSDRTARQMGHLPLAGDDGSLHQLAQLTTVRKILVHINNTNPILMPHAPERKIVEATGVEVGYDGQTIVL